MLPPFFGSSDDNHPMATVLLVDDDPALLEVLVAYLAGEGHSVLTAGNGLEALPLLAQADVAVLDWMLPGLSGLDVLELARKTLPNLPILLLTARGEEDDRVRGLDAGADDYVVKPFSPREIVARIRALLRRSGKGGPGALEVRGLTLDPERRTVLLEGVSVTLSKLEFDLLSTLIRHPGLVWTRERLLERVWGMDYPGVDRVVDVHMNALRRKLGDDATEPRFLETVRGVGYRFRDTP